MEQETIRAREIELVDEEGEAIVVLTGTNENDKAGLVASGVEEDAEVAMIAIDREAGTPLVLLQARDSEAHIILTFDGGEPKVLLQNADGQRRHIAIG